MEVDGPRYRIEGVEHRTSLLGKTLGLMFRSSGRVLLSFGRDDWHGVWMPFMRMRLDIAFLDAEKTVVDIRRDVPPVGPHPRTWRVYRPGERCRHVLEVEAGLFDEKGVSVGDKLSF